MFQCHLGLTSEIDLVALETVILENEWTSWWIENNEGKIALVGIFDSLHEAEENWQKLRVCCSFLPSQITITQANPDSWKSAFKQYIRPRSFGPLHWIPDWEPFHCPTEELCFRFEVGPAFGTGAHETTQLCAQRLVEIYQTDPRFSQFSVLDLGCGSGILGLSAKLLGCQQLLCLDCDPDATTLAQTNAQLNHLTQNVSFETNSLEHFNPPWQADLIFANIQSNILCANGAKLRKALAYKGHLVLSGILSSELPQVIAHFSLQTNNYQSQALGEWSDLYIHN